MNNVSFADRRSVATYNCVRFRTALRILNIEIADAHRSLRRNRLEELHLVRVIYNSIPAYLLDNFVFSDAFLKARDTD